MRQYLITVGLLVAALFFYVVGLPVVAIAFAALAGLSESTFWIRVLLSRGMLNDLH